MAQGQLDAYNKRNLETFLKYYSPNVEIFDFPNAQARVTGISEIRKIYEKLFAENPELHCELVNRMALGSVVIDHESVTGLVGRPPIKAIAIYEIKDNLIQTVRFIK
ncbi:MAG: nuclear transport factor 2 family protein [Oligoflexia bacterium]|nr:nuclear transport factor 2 family protein [Oligoflexia bacterium]